MTGAWRRLGGWLDDRLNPIVVKELRQAVRGRFVSAVMNVLLLVQVGVLLVYLLTSGVDTVDVVSSDGHGDEVFGAIYAFLLLTSIVVLPLYTSARFAVEQSSEAFSLLFLSTLPPWRIVSGKLFASLVLMLMLFAACLPFVSFTYFLRGVDLPSVLVSFGLGLVVATVCLQAMILLACLPGSRFFKMLLGLIGAVGLFLVFSATMQVAFQLLRSGVGSRIGTSDFWTRAGIFLVLAAFFGAVAFLLSAALVSPPMSNRALPVRLFLSGTWLVSGLALGLATSGVPDTDPIVAWLTTWVAVAVGALAVAISSRDRMSARVAREVPRSVARRAAAFFFWSGSANGVAWALATVTATLAAGLALNGLAPGGRVLGHVGGLAGFAAYGFAYALTALLVHRRLLAHRVAISHTWAVAGVLVTLGFVVPLVVAFFISPEEFQRSSFEWGWSFLNPFSAFEDDLRDPALRFSLLWAGAAGALALPWFLAQLRDFGRAGRTGSRPTE